MSFEETIVRTSVKHRRSFTLRTKRQLKAYSCRPWLQVAVLIFLQPSAVRATLPCVAQSFILSPATTFATLKRVTHDSALYVRWLKDGRLERGSDKVVGLRGNCFESYKEKRDYRWRLVRFTADRTCPRVHDENVYTSERKFPVRDFLFSTSLIFSVPRDRSSLRKCPCSFLNAPWLSLFLALHVAWLNTFPFSSLWKICSFSLQFTRNDSCNCSFAFRV